MLYKKFIITSIIKEKNNKVEDDLLKKHKEKLDGVLKEKQRLEKLVTENQEREAAVREENSREFKELSASHEKSMTKLIKEGESKLKVLAKKTADIVKKIKEDDKREEEEMVAEQEREEREAPSCPVNIMQFLLLSAFCTL